MLTGNRPELILPRPSIVICLSVCKRIFSETFERSLGVVQWYLPFSQYSEFFVLGVPPPTTSTSLPIEETSHPTGINPNSDSTSSSGNRAAVAASCWYCSGGSWSSSGSSLPLMAHMAARSGSRPAALASILALTGSKSTNQLLKMVWAICSRVWLIWRLSSILSSRVPTISAILSSTAGSNRGMSRLFIALRLKVF